MSRGQSSVSAVTRSSAGHRTLPAGLGSPPCRRSSSPPSASPGQLWRQNTTPRDKMETAGKREWAPKLCQAAQPPPRPQQPHKRDISIRVTATDGRGKPLGQATLFNRIDPWGFFLGGREFFPIFPPQKNGINRGYRVPNSLEFVLGPWS